MEAIESKVSQHHIKLFICFGLANRGEVSLSNSQSFQLGFTQLELIVCLEIVDYLGI